MYIRGLIPPIHEYMEYYNNSYTPGDISQQELNNNPLI